MKAIHTFSGHSMVSFKDQYGNFKDINMRDIRYTETDDDWCKIIEDDMPKLKQLLGDSLYKFILENNGGNTIEIPQDEVWSESQALYERAKQLAYETKVPTDQILEPMLVEYGYKNSKGETLITHAICCPYDEDTSKVPTEAPLGEGARG